MASGVKICKRCLITKPFSEFYRDFRVNDGLQARCKVCYSSYNKKRYDENPEGFQEKGRVSSLKRYHDNVEKNRELRRNYYHVRRSENIEYFREREKRLQRKRCSSPKGKLNNSMGSGVWASLKGNKNGRKWESLVGYTCIQLKEHLENQFQAGMTWDNYGKKEGQWSIDHVKPKSAFNLPEELIECWTLSNLQPLWHQGPNGNCSKGNKF